MSAVKLHITVLFLMVSSLGFAQQEWLYTQYIFNLYDVNGAFAGSYGELSMAARLRSQWVGIEGAPQSQSISLHMPLKDNLGVGLRGLYEEIGLRSRIHVKGSFAYRLPTETGKLSLGINAGIIAEQLNISDAVVRESGDPIVSGDPSGVVPAFDASLFFQTRKFFTGVQLENLNASTVELYPGSSFSISRHGQAIAGAAFPLGSRSAIRPSALIRWSDGGSKGLEANVAWFWNNALWLGAGYRLNFGMVAFAEYSITPRFRLGYSYDYATGQLAAFQSGSHEIFLGWNVALGDHSGRSIRYFR